MHNHGQNIVDKSPKLSKIGVSLAFFRLDLDLYKAKC